MLVQILSLNIPLIILSSSFYLLYFSPVLILTNSSFKENVAGVIFTKQIFSFTEDKNKKDESTIVAEFSIIEGITLKIVL